MNLLAKYKAMHEALNNPPEIIFVENKFINTEEKQNNTNTIIQNGPLRDISAISAKPSPVVEGSTRVAPEKIVAPPPPVEALWRNPFKQGTPEARQESLRIIEEAKHGAYIHDIKEK